MLSNDFNMQLTPCMYCNRDIEYASFSPLDVMFCSHECLDLYLERCWKKQDLDYFEDVVSKL